jgi:hypothetical protein
VLGIAGAKGGEVVVVVVDELEEVLLGSDGKAEATAKEER